jgi:hypothetical protein
MALVGTTRSTSIAKRVPSEGGVPAVAGLYAWWSREGAIPGLPERPHPTEPTLSLLYVGISPARLASSQTLRGRVLRNHLCGNTGSSTFRFTLAALLCEPRGWSPTKRNMKYLLNDADNEELSGWQRENLALTWAVRERPWEIEAEVIAAMEPPLNLAANGKHPFAANIREARTAFRHMGADD